ncbi:MAG: hypothetical protein D6798_12570, partial [Deltaproteobacteria bacterium]
MAQPPAQTDLAVADPASIAFACLGSLCCLVAFASLVGLAVWLLRRSRGPGGPAPSGSASAPREDTRRDEPPRGDAPQQ